MLVFERSPTQMSPFPHLTQQLPQNHFRLVVQSLPRKNVFISSPPFPECVYLSPKTTTSSRWEKKQKPTTNKYHFRAHRSQGGKKPREATFIFFSFFQESRNLSHAFTLSYLLLNCHTLPLAASLLLLFVVVVCLFRLLVQISDSCRRRKKASIA